MSIDRLPGGLNYLSLGLALVMAEFVDTAFFSDRVNIWGRP